MNCLLYCLVLVIPFIHHGASDEVYNMPLYNDTKDLPNMTGLCIDGNTKVCQTLTVATAARLCTSTKSEELGLSFVQISWPVCKAEYLETCHIEYVYANDSYNHCSLDCRLKTANGSVASCLCILYENKPPLVIPKK